VTRRLLAIIQPHAEAHTGTTVVNARATLTPPLPSGESGAAKRDPATIGFSMRARPEG
jgi:hypothetical protein